MTLRIIHTSDWHLGHTLHGQSRQFEHEAFLAWLLDRLEDERVDALLIAGDIFETSNPSAEAQRTFYEFLGSLRRRLPDLDVVVIGGNHDSAARLDAPDALFASHGVKVVGGIRCSSEGHDAERALAQVTGADGSRGWVAAVPFLRRGDLDVAVLREQGHVAAVHDAYERVLDGARARRSANEPLLAMGHGYMVGGQLSEDSERNIVRGAEEALPVDVFAEDVAYVALGHLHLAQAVGGHEHVRYSGSPIPLSMNEDGYPHQVLVVDFEGEALSSVRELPVPRAVPLIRLSHAAPLGIDATLERLRALDVSDRPVDERPFLHVSVLIDRVEPNLRPLIVEAIGDAPVRLVRIEPTYVHGSRASLADLSTDKDLSDLAPSDVFSMMHERAHDAPPDEGLMQAFRMLEQRLSI